MSETGSTHPESSEGEGENATSPDTERPSSEPEGARPETPTERKLGVHGRHHEDEVDEDGWEADPEATVNLTGDIYFPPPRDDLASLRDADEASRADHDHEHEHEHDDGEDDGPEVRPFAPMEVPRSVAPDGRPQSSVPESAKTQVYTAPGRSGSPAGASEQVPGEVARAHLKGLLEALIFVSDKPIKAADLAKTTSAPLREVRELLMVLKDEFAPRGIQLDEVAGGWIFRTSPAYAPFVRDLTKTKPVKLTRAQIESLAILAYRQPITRPEIDDIRGVDSGPVLKVLLERDLVRILGKKDEPGRPLIYGTTQNFLEFFGLKSLRDLPTLREFTELNEDSRRVVERELGDVLEDAQEGVEPTAPVDPREYEDPEPRDTLSPALAAHDDDPEQTLDTPLEDASPATQAGSQIRAAAESQPEPDDDDDDDESVSEADLVEDEDDTV